MDKTVEKVCADIRALAEPEKIILYNEKQGMGGGVSSFKLCVIVDAEEPRRADPRDQVPKDSDPRDSDPRSLEERIYMQVECPVTFDVLVYSRADWERLLSEPDSFARRIAGMGRVLYEQAR